MFVLALATVGAPLNRAPNFSRASAPAGTPDLSRVPATLPWTPDGHSFWQWQGSGVQGGSRVHFLASGPEDARPLVLVHGFGASWFHWRYNIPELSKRFRVYAVDLVGFGLSDKPLLTYSAELWAAQLADFVSEVVAPRAPCKAAIAGNSLGGFASLATAAVAPELLEGVALLNCAGSFAARMPLQPEKVDADGGPLAAWTASIRQQIVELTSKLVLYASFTLAKQPTRIRQVLQQVYAIDPTNVDDDLVRSIAVPAGDPNAAEIFYRIVSKNAIKPTTTIDALLGALAPALDVLLLWGEHDPWIRPQAADQIQALRPSARRVSINAGHCPHDEAPAAVNDALAAWLDQLPGGSMILPDEPIIVSARWPGAIAPVAAAGEDAGSALAL
jgi:pimeloyl-ACP methyl ester carboxylesterase